jgi:hypothetical protein
MSELGLAIAKPSENMIYLEMKRNPPIRRQCTLYCHTYSKEARATKETEGWSGNRGFGSTLSAGGLDSRRDVVYLG